jgi:hypothetical protein
MEELSKVLREARLRASVGAMTEAERLVHVAFALVEAVPRESWLRIVYGYIGVAGFTITIGNSRLAALVGTLKLRAEMPEKGK